MNYGFVKVAAFSPKIKLACIDYNVSQIVSSIDDACKSGVKVLVFPELCLTGSTLGDLFYSSVILDGVAYGLSQLMENTISREILVFVGAPLMKDNKIYDCAVAIYDGRILGVVPKSYFHSHCGQNLSRQFTAFNGDSSTITINNQQYPFGNKILFQNSLMENMIVGVEIGDEMNLPISPATCHCLRGADIIVNLSAQNEIIGAYDNRQLVIKDTSRKNLCGYVFANSGEGESTTDLVFCSRNLIMEKGKILASDSDLLISEIDVDNLYNQRRKNYKFTAPQDYTIIKFEMEKVPCSLSRTFSSTPFIPKNDDEINQRAKLILSMQVQSLKQRVQKIGAKCLVIGVSGGLDSCLALLVCVNVMRELGRSERDVVAITMPCFGTTKRTLNNSVRLSQSLGVTIEKIDIAKAVKQHFIDIGQDINTPDVTYENCQARERTQVLMDVANKMGGIVVGTGDLSEVALGWSTYNGDHMSMYGVNCGIPKTLLKYIIGYVSDNSDKQTAKILLDILDTPVSPELLPNNEDEIVQKTEDIVGPYILHDFFLYHFIKHEFSPSKIYYLAKHVFANKYNSSEIYKWLTLFLKRFFTQQFKRSCIPDGVKVGSVGLSPRGDYQMPSDAYYTQWMNELDKNI